LKQFGDVINLILLAAAVVSGIIGDLTDTFCTTFYYLFEHYNWALSGSKPQLKIR
jgi:hypothetical protein